MKFNAETARKKMNENIQKKIIEKRKQEAEKAVDEILVPIIEETIENCGYQVYVKKSLLDDYCVSDCYAVLEKNGFKYTNYRDEFLIEW